MAGAIFKASLASATARGVDLDGRFTGRPLLSPISLLIYSWNPSAVSEIIKSDRWTTFGRGGDIEIERERGLFVTCDRGIAYTVVDATTLPPTHWSVHLRPGSAKSGPAGFSDVRFVWGW